MQLHVTDLTSLLDGHVDVILEDSVCKIEAVCPKAACFGRLRNLLKPYDLLQGTSAHFTCISYHILALMCRAYISSLAPTQSSRNENLYSMTC